MTTRNKKDMQNFTVFLPKEFHREFKLYAVAKDEQMSTILSEIIRRGVESYKKENPEFPDWES